MGLEYVNRCGERYFVLHGKTPKGNAKYYCSKKAGENSVQQLPEGFELRENPQTGQVTVRKKRSSPLLPFERELLVRIIETRSKVKHAIVDVDGKSLVVYTPDTDADAAVRIMSIMIGSIEDASSLQDEIVRHSSYSPMMRFTLTNPEERLFSLERWCFSGSIDDWIYIAGDRHLDELASAYAPHLGQDSFFEMM
jgi:hypothetical protein